MRQEETLALEWEADFSSLQPMVRQTPYGVGEQDYPKARCAWMRLALLQG